MKAAPIAAVFPGREQLLESVRTVLDQYEGTAVTVRQLYYRLVAAHAIPNSVRSYKNVVAALSQWRRERKIPLTAFEDRTRGMKRFDDGWRRDDPRSWVRQWLDMAVRRAKGYELAQWYGQPERVVVAVEKQALEGPFEQVCRELAVDLAVCRGYPSLSFLHEVAGALGRGDPAHDGRKIVLLYFGDFDPSGLNIPEVVERDLAGFFRVPVSFERVALTREQIDERNLPPAPVKLTDSRAGGFVDEHGEEVYELDALEPRELQELVRSSVAPHYDAGIADHAKEVAESGREEIGEMLEEAGVVALLDRLNRGDGGEHDPDQDDESTGDGA
jgi:hypothetical protein